MPPIPGDQADSGGDSKELQKPAPEKPVAAVIGDAASWPSLSESTRASGKSSSSTITDASVVASQGPATPHLPQNPRHTNSTLSPNFHPNPNRQRLTRRGGSAGGGSTQSGFSRHPPPHLLASPPPQTFYPVFEAPYSAVPEHSIRGPLYHGNGFQERPIAGFGSHSRPVDHHFSEPSSSQRSGHRARHRGDGARQFDYGNRYRPHHDWNASQSFHARDVRFAQSGLPVGFVMPSQSLVPFPYMHAPMLPPESFMGLPYTGHAPLPSPSPPPLSPHVDLPTKLLNQIHYYFSNENLIKDSYLRSKMDSEGWVPVTLIAGFRKVQEMTDNIQLILDSIRASSVVEVQGDKLRRRNDWRRWISTYDQLPIASGSQSTAESNSNTIMSSFQNFSLEDIDADRNSTASNASQHPTEVSIRISSQELAGHS